MVMSTFGCGHSGSGTHNDMSCLHLEDRTQIQQYIQCAKEDTLLHTHANYSGLLPLINIIMTDDIVIELITIPGLIDESF